MKFSTLYLTLYRSLSPHVIQAPLTQVIGVMPDFGTDAATSASLAQNGASAAGGVNFTTAAGATNTMTNLGNALFRFTVGSAMTGAIDSDYNIAKTLPQPLTVAQQFSFRVITNAPTTIATPTLSDTAVTLSGTTSVTAAGLREYVGAITQVNTTVGMPVTAGTTFTSLTQVGSTNNFTVVLGTNALIPVVGTLIYLNVTAGTLPSGWYPINLVTNAGSFVIATPGSQVWTMTAGTVGTGIVAPSTYSPTMTITGVYGSVLNTFAV